MSFKPEVQTDRTGQWYSNHLRFTTREEAINWVADLRDRWTAVIDTRVTESPEPVNYRYHSGTLTRFTGQVLEDTA